MHSFRFQSNLSSVEISIPAGWRSSPIIDSADLWSGSENNSDSRTIIGPNGKYLNLVITKLADGDPEPAISRTEQFFDGFAQRQGLNIIATGTINIANKSHFWATYHRGFFLTLAAGGQMQFFKKYCLYLSRFECLITAGYHFVQAGGKLPSDQELGESEKVFDEIVKSIRIVGNEGA